MTAAKTIYSSSAFPGIPRGELLLLWMLTFGQKHHMTQAAQLTGFHWLGVTCEISGALPRVMQRPIVSACRQR